MQLTTESRRVRWIGLILAWVVVTTVLLEHAVAFRAYINTLDSIALRGAKVAPTPLHRICPTMYADAQMWVRHALALANGSGPQLRHTTVDNAPFGREVHWNSPFAWAIAGAGWLRHIFLGESLTEGTEQAMAWFNVPLLLAIVVGFSTWVARRAGLGAGVTIALMMVGNPDFYSGFSPNYVDHHGLLAAAVLGVALGAIFMGVGFWRTEKSAALVLPDSFETARAGAIVSAVSGAIGMWISAATLIPAIAITGIAGAVVIVVYGRELAEYRIALEPRIWRLWGAYGAVLCFVFYLLEYAPMHLGFRLEVNHPVYALGWWGGSELIAQLAEWRLSRADQFRPKLKRLMAALAAISVAPAIIAVGGEKVFVVFDPFVTRLSTHVAEGLSLMKSAKTFGWGRFLQEFSWVIVALVVWGIGWWRSKRTDRPLLLFSILAFAAFASMGVAQIRWLSSVSGPEIALIVVSLCALVGGISARLRWLIVGVVLSATFVPSVVQRISLQTNANKHRVVDATDAMQPVYRDIAAALRESQPKGDIVLLASPNASVAISYYGMFSSIGTLYWENLEGTKAAAEIFSASSESEARQLVRRRGITHIAMVSTENFLAEYYDLLHPNGTREQLEKSFGYQLLVQQQVPAWLEVIPYQVPSDVPVKVDRILLFKTKFAAPQAENLYEKAVGEINRGRIDLGESTLDEALRIAPQSAEFWLIKAHLLLFRKNVESAVAAVDKALDGATAIQKPTICGAEAARFYSARAYAAAVALYRREISLQPNAVMMNNLAWILATAPDDRVRNGAEALQISEALIGNNKGIDFLSTYAAALAEVGRFDEAIKAQSAVFDVARKEGSGSIATNAENRLNRYRQNKPWRE